MALIQFSKIRCSFAFCFLLAISKIINYYIYELLKLVKKTDGKPHLMDQVTYYLYWIIGLFFSSFLYCPKKKQNDLNPPDINRYSFIPLQSQTQKQKVNPFLFLFLFLLTPVQMLTVRALYELAFNTPLFMKAFSFPAFIVVYFWCYLLFKTKLFKHQWVSFIFIAIGTVTIIATDYILLSENMQKSKITLRFIILSVLLVLLETVRDVGEKYLMHVYFFKKGKIMFYEAFFCLVIFGFMIIIGTAFNNKVDLSIVDFFNFLINNYYSWLVLLLFSIDAFMICYFRLSIIYHLSPHYVSISSSIVYVFNCCITLASANNTLSWIYITLDVISLILVLFGTLLFNEVFIVYLCDLEVNTKKEIEKRSINEVKLCSFAPAIIDIE